jgi:putative membrane protein insertion efficiency factor
VAPTLVAKLSRLPAEALLLLVRGYRFFLSPWLGSACRFEPTCSAYSLQALDKHGAAAGTYLTLHRLARCGPWCPGGHDPVPDHAPRLFAGLTSGAHPSTSSDKTAP